MPGKDTSDNNDLNSETTIDGDTQNKDDESPSGCQQIVVASRPSKLALIQTQMAIDALQLALASNPQSISKDLPEFIPKSFKTIKVESLGDQRPDTSLSDLVAELRESGTDRTAVFATAVERSILMEHAAFAVHSLKDLPSNVFSPDDPFAYPAILERGDPRDALVLRNDLVRVSLTEYVAGRRHSVAHILTDIEILIVSVHLTVSNMHLHLTDRMDEC